MSERDDASAGADAVTAADCEHRMAWVQNEQRELDHNHAMGSGHAMPCPSFAARCSRECAAFACSLILCLAGVGGVTVRTTMTSFSKMMGRSIIMGS